jgi:hypothetical protein
MTNGKCGIGNKKNSMLTPDLNIPAMGLNAIVPVGLVNSRVHQLGGGSESSGGSLEETTKKKKER